MEQAKGQLAQAEAQRGLAQINLKRDTPLAAPRAIAQSQLDNEKQQAAQADAAVATAQAAISAAQASSRNRKTEPWIYAGALADRRRGRTGHDAGRQSGDSAIGADFGLATGSDQGLLLHQRCRISGADRGARTGAAATCSAGMPTLPLTLTLADGTTIRTRGTLCLSIGR